MIKDSAKNRRLHRGLNPELPRGKRSTCLYPTLRSKKDVTILDDKIKSVSENRHKSWIVQET